MIEVQSLFCHSGFQWSFYPKPHCTLDITPAHENWEHAGSVLVSGLKTAIWCEIDSDNTENIPENKTHSPTPNPPSSPSTPNDYTQVNAYFFPLKISNDIILLSWSTPSRRWHNACSLVGTLTQDLPCQMTESSVTLRGNLSWNCTPLTFCHLDTRKWGQSYSHVMWLQRQWINDIGRNVCLGHCVWQEKWAKTELGLQLTFYCWLVWWVAFDCKTDCFCKKTVTEVTQKCSIHNMMKVNYLVSALCLINNWLFKKNVVLWCSADWLIEEATSSFSFKREI